MKSKKPKEKNERKLLEEINERLETLVLLISLQGKDKKDQKKILEKYTGIMSKRELERITGIDRHDF